jgi:hypothetical protein
MKTKEVSTARIKNTSPNGCAKRIKRELTSEEEKAAFLYTSKVNSASIFAKYLDY